MKRTACGAVLKDHQYVSARFGWVVYLVRSAIAKMSRMFLPFSTDQGLGTLRYRSISRVLQSDVLCLLRLGQRGCGYFESKLPCSICLCTDFDSWLE